MSVPFKDNIYGSEFWLNSASMNFYDILTESRVPEKWKRFDLVEDQFLNLPIKPINRYVSNLYPIPELISLDVENLKVVLRQKTHAEIWVEPRANGLYALDKTWQRQFYPSNNKYTHIECFDPTYKFYMPWFFDGDAEAKVFKVDGSPFHINDKDLKFKTTHLSQQVDVNFVDFKIYKVGSHMVSQKYGIIDIGTPMYDLEISLTEKEMNAVYEQYR
jgi:hypothetical protein